MPIIVEDTADVRNSTSLPGGWLPHISNDDDDLMKEEVLGSHLGESCLGVLSSALEWITWV